MYERFLPDFKVVEINNSTAHRIGHAISQVPAYKASVAHVTVGKYDFVENGIIVGLGADAQLSNYDVTKHNQPCLVYNDELITGPIDSLNKYAEEIEAGKPVYLRALPLYLGDSFTTNNFTGEPQNGFATVDGGVLKVTDSSTGAMFIAKLATLPNGEEAIEFTYIGTPAKVTA